MCEHFINHKGRILAWMLCYSNPACLGVLCKMGRLPAWQGPCKGEVQVVYIGSLASRLAQRRGTTKVKSTRVRAISHHPLALFFGFSSGEKPLWELMTLKLAYCFM